MNCFGDSGLIIDYIKTLVKDTYAVTSAYEFYDAKTHFYFAKYLKELRDRGINLFSMYNAFTNSKIDEQRIQLSSSGTAIIDNSNSCYDLVYIQVEPKDVVTFFIDCPVPVIIATGAYNGRRFVTNTLNNVKRVSFMQTSKPYKYEVKQYGVKVDESRYSQLCNDNLVLLVQIPKTVAKRVALLGDYTSILNNVINYRVDAENGDNPAQLVEIEKNIAELIDNTISIVKPNLEGLRRSDKQVAFDKAIIPYILKYAITQHDDEIENIGSIQDAISSPNAYINLGVRYTYPYTRGVLDNKQRAWLHDLQLLYSTANNSLNTKRCSPYNAIGLVNPELELLILRDGRRSL